MRSSIVVKIRRIDTNKSKELGEEWGGRNRWVHKADGINSWEEFKDLQRLG